jgi:hypothetical protein
VVARQQYDNGAQAEGVVADDSDESDESTDGDPFGDIEAERNYEWLAEQLMGEVGPREILDHLHAVDPNLEGTIYRGVNDEIDMTQSWIAGEIVRLYRSRSGDMRRVGRDLMRGGQIRGVDLPEDLERAIREFVQLLASPLPE